ncbi:MAG: FAD-dependent oxidoreductase [Candidatus Omnitrophota bacterium]
MKQFIIIGNSAAGIAAVEAIRKRDKQSKVTVISDEDYPAYCRCLISYYLAGEAKEDKLVYRPDSFYKENNVEFLMNKKVARVDPKKNRIIMEDKSQLGYDALMIATGARPKFPELKGIKRPGVFGFRTIKDAQNISGLLPVTKAVCVLGGGLIGLKAAYALKKRNIDVKVIIKSKQVLSQMLDVQAAGLVQQRLEEHGIEVLLGQDASEIIGEGGIKAIKLESGKAIGCSMVIVGKGVTPNIELVKESEVQSNEGIIANNFLQTNTPNIYTGGDACESFDIALGAHASNALWPVAVEQGKIAGGNMAGDGQKYGGSIGMNSLEFFGLPVISLGIYKAKGGDSSFEELKLSNLKENLYKKIILKSGVIVGAVLVGDIKNSGLYLSLIRQRIDTSAFKDKLLEENFGYPVIKDLMQEQERIYV